MTIDWLSLTQENLAIEASLYRHDHDDGSPAFFDSHLADWSLDWLNPHDLNAFESTESAQIWIHEEIKFLKESGDSERSLIY